MAMTATGPRRRLRCLIMFVPPNGLNTCWLSGNARLSTRNRSSRVHSDSQRSALFRDSQLDLPGAGGILALAPSGGSADRRSPRCATAGSGRPWRQSHSQILRPTSKTRRCRLFVIAKRGLVADAAAEVEGQAFPGAVLVHELSRRPVLGR